MESKKYKNDITLNNMHAQDKPGYIMHRKIDYIDLSS